ncbi:Ribosomal RNA large subunit methyltransferase, partial [Fasciolopsis buskii]
RQFGRTAVAQDAASSQRWLARQRSDPYVRRARLESFRCRSAFKLIQLHERVPGGLIYPGDVVLDCGAAPGSWTQVAASICSKPNSHSPGLVVSFDLLDFAHVPGARCYPHTDVQNWELCARLVNEAIAEHYATSKPEDRPTGASLVLSDMAPNASGIREMDVPAMINLASAVLQLAVRASAPGARLVIKLWQCPEAELFRKLVSQFYSGPWDLRSVSKSKKALTHGVSNSQMQISDSMSAVRFLKPTASRSDSAEVYLVAKGFNP